MQNEKRRIEKKTLFILWGMLAAACVLIFHGYVLGNETMVFSDVGSDTRDQYVLWFNSLANHLKAGNFSLWDFCNGLGSSMFQINLFYPLLVPVYLLGMLTGPEHIAGFMVYFQIAQILLAGTNCYFFLSETGSSERSKLAASFIYAFNGYLMVWGQHYQLGYAAVFLPLLLMFVERSLRKRRAALGAAAVSGLIVLSGFYLGYMCMLGGGIYVVFRVLLYEDAKWKKKWKDFFAVGASMALGVLMGAVNLLPAAAFQVGSSGRLQSELTLVEKIIRNLIPYSRNYYKTFVYRLFGTNLQNSALRYSGDANYYEAVNLFFSTLFIILLLQYLFTIHRQNKKTAQKLVQYLAVAAAAFLVCIQAGSLPFNGFAYPFSRHTFLLMPLFALVCAKTLDQIFEEKRLSIAALAAAVAGILVVYSKAYRYMDGTPEKNNALLLCLTGLVMAGTLFAVVKKKGADKKLCTQILLAALFVNVVSDTMLCYQNRDTVRKNDIVYFAGTYDSSVNEALAWIAGQDSSFYRVEKDFYTASGFMDAMAQGYRGVSTYNSVQNANVAKFVRKLWPQLLIGNDNNHYRFSNSIREQAMASLTGVKYLLSRSDDLHVEGYELYHRVGDIIIYRNTETDSIGKFFTKTVTEKKFEKLKRADVWDLVKDVLITENADDLEISDEELESYSGERIELLDEARLDQKTVKWQEDTLTISDAQPVYLPLKQQELGRYDTVWVKFKVETDAGTEIKFRMNDERSHACYQYTGEHTYKFAVPADTKQITVEIMNPQVTAKITELKFFGRNGKGSFSDAAEIRIDAPQTDSRLTGTVHADTKGIVMLAVPYENGWSVSLNGEEQEIIKGDYGFIAFEVDSGDYNLELKYDAPMFKAGMIISLVSCLLFVVIWIGTGKRKSDKERRNQ